MNKEDPFRDQAERLRQRIGKIHETPDKRDLLPPRSDLHKHKKKKTNLKFKYPIIRLLFLFFILLPITIFSAYSYLEDQKNKGVENVINQQSGYETINFQDNNENGTKNASESKDENKQTEAMDSPENSDSSKFPEGMESNLEEGKVNLPAKNDAIKNPVSNTVSQPSKNSEEFIYHKVQHSETLFRIAMKYYQSQAGVDIIKKDNGIKGNEIQAGQLLKIRAGSK